MRLKAHLEWAFSYLTKRDAPTPTCIVSLLIVSSAHDLTMADVLSQQLSHCFMTICQPISQLTELFEHKTSHRSVARVSFREDSAGPAFAFASPTRSTSATDTLAEEQRHCPIVLTWLIQKLFSGPSCPLFSLHLFCRSLFSSSALIQLPNCQTRESILRTQLPKLQVKLLPLTRCPITLANAEIRNNFKLYRIFQIVNL